MSAPVWPDEATVERARMAVRAYLEQENTCSCHEAYRSRGMDDPQCAFHAVIYMDGDADIARAALSVLPDPTSDTGTVFADDLLERGTRRLLEEVDRSVRLGHLNARSRIADAALDLAGHVGYQMGTADLDGYMQQSELDALMRATDPAAGTVLLAKVREIVDEWDQRGATWCMTRIAALLAGGGE